jgi:hypothetical protein
LQALTATTWDATSTPGGCSVGNFTGDWGEPSFATPADLALICLQCYRPQTVLRLVLSNDASKPNRWLWLKSGKFATAP